ncbi:MAG TPA: hypothetical protein PLP29_10790 [Candidatus Ozemobacteraceae bacterium]|nr:hypothetical protein [Candidatus Ozemobacteraceae bacterium]
MQTTTGTPTPFADLPGIAGDLIETSMRLSSQFSKNLEKIASIQIETLTEIQRRQSEITNLVLDETLKAARIIRNHSESLFHRAIDRQAQTQA